MIDRVGQVWELDDGLIFLIVRSKPWLNNGRPEPGATCHDVLFLTPWEYDDGDDSGRLQERWRELDHSNGEWNACGTERWRLA